MTRREAAFAVPVTGESISADEARTLGLVDRVVEAEAERLAASSR